MASYSQVRDHIPLEQGLRLCAVDRYLADEGQRPYSIRTRIKTFNQQICWFTFGVRDHIPLEQGLRHSPDNVAPKDADVRDHIPLEQGLRL